MVFRTMAQRNAPRRRPSAGLRSAGRVLQLQMLPGTRARPHRHRHRCCRCQPTRLSAVVAGAAAPLRGRAAATGAGGQAGNAASWAPPRAAAAIREAQQVLLSALCVPSQRQTQAIKEQRRATSVRSSGKHRELAGCHSFAALQPPAEPLLGEHRHTWQSVVVIVIAVQKSTSYRLLPG
jgi:hypothetical protein